MRCNVCKKHVKDDEAWICEDCGGEHHPKCSGDSSSGTGEYPDEDAYSVCMDCCLRNRKD